MGQPTLPAVEPKPPKHLRQPTKHAMREQLRLAADRIMQLEAEKSQPRAPWWQRLFTRRPS